MEVVPVGIVGGGPCGLLTALLLARSGIRCEVFERKPGLSTHPKAMGVSRRTAEIYRSLGLTGRFVEGALDLDDRVLSIWAKSLVGEEFGRTPIADFRSPLTPCVSMHCPQTWTEQVLMDAVQQEPLAAVHFSTEVTGLVADDDGVTLTLASGGPRRADWVVAADGASSGVRHQLGIPTAGRGDMGHFVNVMFRAPYGSFLRERQAVMYQIVSETGLNTFVSVNGDDLWLMHHFLQPGESVDDYSFERFSAIVKERSGLPEVPVEVLGLSPWVMNAKVSERFQEGRVLLTGDAAARLSPAGGLGLNTGLQSAHNLTWKLAAVVSGGAGEGLLRSYEIERRPAAARTLDNTNRNSDEIFAIVGAAVSGEWDQVREMVGQSRRGGSGLGQDLGLFYTDGAFVPDGTEAPAPTDPVNEYLPVARPGHRAPHLAVSGGGERTSLLDFFGGKFCLLAGRNGGMWPQAKRHHRDFTGDGFEELYGIGFDGAVLVRPDGYVGARFFSAPSDPADSVDEAMRTILQQTGEARSACPAFLA